MDETAESEPIHWRRDATTSRTVRILWSLGVGTFFAMIGIIVFWRLWGLTGQIGGQSVLAALAAGLLVTILAFAVAGRTEQRLDRIATYLPIDVDSGRSLERVMDAAIGTLAMVAIIVALMTAGRYVSETPFTGLAALTVPLALVALVLASFLRSVGALDREEEVIYLYDPDQAVDLEVIEGVSVRRFGDAAIVRLRYATPDGQYVAGPRRIVVPPAIAREIETLVG